MPDKPIIVDARGYSCPKPVTMTRESYDKAPDGARLDALVDTPVQAGNVRDSIRKAGGKAEIVEKDDYYVVEIVKVQSNACEMPHGAIGSPHVIYISSSTMGKGNDELGAILIKAFINTIKDASPLPSHVIFVNSGVLLTSGDEPIVDSLKHLEGMGVEILSCGTCLNFYNRAEHLKVGSISNMFDILQTLTSASRVVAP